VLILAAVAATLLSLVLLAQAEKRLTPWCGISPVVSSHGAARPGATAAVSVKEQRTGSAREEKASC
jgi:hypothetical protein